MLLQEAAAPTAMGRGGQNGAAETVPGRKKPFSGAGGEQAWPSSPPPCTGQTQLLQQPPKPNHGGVHLQKPLCLCTTLKQEPLQCPAAEQRLEGGCERNLHSRGKGKAFLGLQNHPSGKPVPRPGGVLVAMGFNYT